MRALGISIKKNELRYCVLEGTRDTPLVVLSDRDRFKPDQSRPALADYFKQAFTEIMTKTKPDVVGYRLSIDVSRADQIAYMCFPFGILNLLCHEGAMPVREFTHHGFTQKALGRPGNKFDVCDEVLGVYGSFWDNDQRFAALSAWMSL